MNPFIAFANGILFLVDILASSWWWIFGVIMFIAFSVVESKDIGEGIIEDERDVL